MSATIKDVAKLAGVSPSTVTRTCQNQPSISEETKRKVRSAMSALGYTSNYPGSGSRLLLLSNQLPLYFRL